VAAASMAAVVAAASMAVAEAVVANSC